MKKRVIFITSGGFLVFLFIIARLTHGLDYLRIPTSSNEPTFHSGDILFASRFKKPDRNQFICFKKRHERSLYLYRCIAKDGDMIEIRDGVVYLNNKKLDEPYTWNEYLISQKQLNTIEGYVAQNHYNVQSIDDSTSMISLAPRDLKKYHLDLKPSIMARGVADSEMFMDFRRYNPDNFGPIKVPKNSYFLLGDNRHNALDSRYIGFIKSEDVVSTVLR